MLCRSLALSLTVLWCLPITAQEAAPLAPPAVRFVDAERARREADLTAASTAVLSGPLRYTCTFDAEADLFRIALEAAVETGGALCLVMPAWAPGAYHLDHNGKHVQDLRVGDGDDGGAGVERRSDDVWQVSGVAPGRWRADYTLQARRFKERTVGRATPPTWQIQGPKIWLHEVRHKRLPCTLELRLPADWDVATGLAAGGGTGGRIAAGHWRFTAPDYDVLADCPLKLGSFECFGFRIGDTTFEVALAGASGDASDRQEFARRLRRISEHFIAMFGGPPFDRYVYLFTVPGGGGLEHLNSTTIGLMDLRGSAPGRPAMWDFVIAHEFFHAWNVKRLRPEALGPFDYTGPNRTSALWFAEGVTSYYGALGLVRAGLWSADDYWKHLGGKFTTLARDRRRTLMSVADSSWQVWDGSYVGGTRRIDYYLKGECLGALLDVTIRAASDNRRSFDDVMRSLYQQSQRTGRGFAEDDIRKACEAAAGTELGDFFDRYVYGTDELPVAEVMPDAGLRVETTGEGARLGFRLSSDATAQGTRLAIRNGLLGAK